MDLIKRFKDISVGITITTDDEGMRKVFEPNAPSISARINALKRLHENGINTYAFIGPILPMKPETLVERIKPHVDSIIIDRMNYASKTIRIYRQLKLERWLDEGFIEEIIQQLKKGFKGKEMNVC
jgi:DNA repair photolyase